MKLSAFFNKIEELLIAFLLSAMTLITFSQVIARYIFSSGVVWALELTTYLFAWLVLIGAAYIIKCGGHIAVDSLVELLPKKARKWLALFTVFVCMIFVVIMFIGSYQYILLLKEIQIELEDLAILEWQAKIVLPLGFSLMFYRLLEVMISVIKNKTLTMHFADKYTNNKD
jgi:C4-dicarboxylate transporter DctQ subunit